MLLPLEHGLLTMCTPSQVTFEDGEVGSPLKEEKYSDKKQLCSPCCLGLVLTQAVQLPSCPLQMQGSLGGKVVLEVLWLPLG